ncbi:sodium-dependent multivitamin transporter-like [Rhipicephalus sanguineus]|uniref:sodium-dependent multivitamin transporter-like n=1 Tax=Rhipicephalus sanguineus TaxID=34632 RepID=UPI0020C28DED|nr:sodium-dependent multivitamin transporter-like [Rhipicephalus sanguineus]
MEYSSASSLLLEHVVRFLDEIAKVDLWPLGVALGPAFTGTRFDRGCFEDRNKAKMSSVVNTLEYVLFAVLVVGNFSLGLYFSFRKHGRHAGRTSALLEVFLGSRTLMMLPLAASSVASVLSSVGLVAIPAHYYAYGWHLMWACTMPLFLFPLATHVFVPVVYRLEVASIFEYIRLRFNSTISITACAIYIILTQSIGAISIFAASLAIQTVFHTPILWCNVAIGLSGTVYTALRIVTLQNYHKGLIMFMDVGRRDIDVPPAVGRGVQV